MTQVLEATYFEYEALAEESSPDLGLHATTLAVGVLDGTAKAVGGGKGEETAVVEIPRGGAGGVGVVGEGEGEGAGVGRCVDDGGSEVGGLLVVVLVWRGGGWWGCVDV